MRILIYDSNDLHRSTLRGLIQATWPASQPHSYFLANEPQSALEIVKDQPVDLAFCDVNSEHTEGMSLLKKISEAYPQTICTATTQRNSAFLIKDCLKVGAFDVIFKPYTWDFVALSLSKALGFGCISRSRSPLPLPKGPDGPLDQYYLQSKSPKFCIVLKEAARLASKNLPILITGESGTGKEVLARMIWALAGDPNRPFVPVHCGALPESLVESSLFGHTKGAFTGAHSDKSGYFDEAKGGDIFLDEVGTMPTKVQISLLRTLNSGEVIPVGSTRGKSLDFRVIAASNEDLDELVRTRQFREDLLYRLKGAELYLPPLRERPEDIVDLVHFFKHQRGFDHKTFTPDAMDLFMGYSWPGNLRQLERLIYVLCELSESDEISADEVRRKLRFSEPTALVESTTPSGPPLNASPTEYGRDDDQPLFQIKAKELCGRFATITEEVEKSLVRYALAHNKDLSKAARFLGITRSLLLRRLSTWGWTDFPRPFTQNIASS